MPLLAIKTSAPLPAPAERDAILLQLSREVSRALGKPERYVMVSLEVGVAMCFAGKTEPTCYAELKSIGGIDRGTTPELSQALCAALEASLGVRQDRIYVEFTNVPGALWGHGGDTFG
jgi:phenylpyruvate tautomerase